MKNGKYCLGHRLCSLANQTLLCACVIAGLATGGCRSSRSVVQETETVEHHEYNASEKNESFHGEASDSIHQRDSVKGSAGERGRIDIERDSTGRPVLILWSLYSDFKAEAATETLGKGLFTLRGSSFSSETSGSVDSLTEKKEEATEEIEAGLPLKRLITSGLAALILFYLIYRLVSRDLVPWIRNRKR